MTDKPDVAALIAELNEWAGSYEEGSFDTEEGSANTDGDCADDHEE